MTKEEERLQFEADIKAAIDDGQKFITAKVGGVVYIVFQDGVRRVGRNPDFKATLDFIPGRPKKRKERTKKKRIRLKKIQSRS